MYLGDSGRFGANSEWFGGDSSGFGLNSLGFGHCSGGKSLPRAMLVVLG